MTVREKLMSQYRELIAEAEKENIGELFSIKEDGYLCTYVKIEDSYVVYKRFYDLSICDKEWFEKNYKIKGIPFLGCKYQETDDPRKAIDVSYEEYLKAKEKAIEQYPDEMFAIKEKKLKISQAREEDAIANDGKEVYCVTILYNIHIGETIYVRANSIEEANEIAMKKHVEFTKDWVYPEAYKYAACKPIKWQFNQKNNNAKN